MSASGQWDWNDEKQSLEFRSFETPVEVKEKKKTSKTSTYQEQFRKHLQKWQRNTVRAAQLDAFKTSIKLSQKTHVTIQDVKLAAVSLLEKDEFPIPLCFLCLLKSKELDEFLACVLLYFSCYFQKKALEEKPQFLMIRESVTERQIKAETCAKVELAQKQLALRYSTLLLGKGPYGLFEKHRMASLRSGLSSIYHDIQLDECLFSFCCYAAWVTFERQDLKVIECEIGRLFRLGLISPALRTESEESDERQKDQERSQNGVKNPRGAALNDRKSNRRLALNGIKTPHSTLMASLLPTPPEKAPHLFGNFRRLKQGLKCSTEHLNSEALLEELNQQLTSLCFGILGKPLSQFSSESLKPQESEAEMGDEEEAHMQIRSRKPSVTAQRSLTTTTDKRSRSGRVGLVSRATTEGVNSDTE